MKAPSLAVAALLGLVSYSAPVQAVDMHSHMQRAPRSQALVDHRADDQFIAADADEQDFEKQTEDDEQEDVTPIAEQEQLIRQMHSASRHANMAQHHATTEDEEDEDQEEKLKRKYSEMEEDDEFIQQSDMMNDEDREEESSDERDYLNEAEEDDEDEYLEQEQDDETNVQVSESDDDDDEAPQAVQIEKVPQRSYFFAGDTNMMADGKEYQRQYPEEFNEDSPNKFMHHILVEYALEKKDDKSQPSGQFLMNKKWTQVAAKEVLQKHKKMDDAAADKYMNQYFGRTWEHFDVNDDQMLDALDMPAFMKYLCSDQSLDLDKL